jgi:hypothetical protein
VPDPAPSIERDPGSFRDPSGFVFRRDGTLYRQINRAYADDWTAVRSSGLLDGLIARGALIPHEEVASELAGDPESAIAVIRPERVEFISYPYEWTFSQLKDAALLTLEVQREALGSGFVLKDASAFNIQFHHGRPTLIDSLSFERAEADAPWVAYRQFCEHFLAPLALMAYRDIRCGLLLREHIDGIPLDLASRLLPAVTRMRLGPAAHIHLHAKAQRRYADRAVETGTRRGMSRSRQEALLTSLRTTIEKLTWQPAGTEWADYAGRTSYDADATSAKESIVQRFLAASGGRHVWDLGANTGRYSRIAADLGAWVLAPDVDPAAAERHYRGLDAAARSSILPLVIDLANPSPDLGWAGRERASLAGRTNADTVMALALVHHLAIGRNVPLGSIAAYFATLARDAIVEWVPKQDPMVQKLLASRRDVFEDYAEAGFRASFGEHFSVVDEASIPGSVRRLLLLRRRSGAPREPALLIGSQPVADLDVMAGR